MLYSSRNGCLFYYDSVLYGWKIADPTTLFLLGLEAVTSFSKSVSDIITISKYVYYKDQDYLTHLNYMDELYDEIYSFLSKRGSVNDYEQYLTYNCYGLKLLLNSMTGTDNDRTIPIIFKSDTNKSRIDLSKVSLRVPSSVSSTMTYFDNQANWIKYIFEDAGYDILNPLPNGYLGITDEDSIDNILPSWSDDSTSRDLVLYRAKLLRDISAYNTTLLPLYNEQVSNSGIYSLLDFKSMYSYSLGVLFGCACLGYNNKYIWRYNPTYWYNGDYKNLVLTAWYTFHFHWTNNKGIFKESSDVNYNQFRDIQSNVIWNFDNSSELFEDSPTLADDEIKCIALRVKDDENYSTRIIYSQDTVSSEAQINKGSYIKRKDDNSLVWDSIDNKINNTDDSYGIILENEQPIIRYFGNDKLVLYKAHSWKDSDNTIHYLAPNQCNYYIYSPVIGWVNYDGTLVQPELTSNIKCNKYFPSLYPISILNDPRFGFYVNDDVIVNDVSLKQPSTMYRYNSNEKIELCMCYECFLKNDSRATDSSEYLADLYGIWETEEQYTSATNLKSNFDRIITGDQFSEEGWNKIPRGYHISTDYFDLDVRKTLVVRDDTDDSIIKTYVYNPDLEEKLTSWYGYSKTPAEQIYIYAVRDENSHTPTEYIFRRIPWGTNYAYWCNNWYSVVRGGSVEDHIYINDSEEDFLYQPDFYWVDVNFLIQSQPDPGPCIKRNTKLSLYLADEIIPAYNNIDVYGALKSDSSIAGNMIYINIHDLSESEPDKYLFADLDVNAERWQDNLIYRHGVTTYPCEVIYRDDQNKPVVWYDSNMNLYWNGLHGINTWQSTRPVITNIQMYDASPSITDRIKWVFEDSTLGMITIDGTDYPYSTFYANPYYGLIKETLSVFKPDADPYEGVIECYHDTNSTYDRYIIPSHPSMQWVSRSDISNMGYRFVDGTETLYNGSTPEQIVIDDDSTD